MHVFLAGATGAVGRRIVPLLIKEGHRVTGTTRRSEKAEFLQSLGAEPVVVDAYDRDRVREVVAAARPDLIMNQLTDLVVYDVAANAKLRREGTRHLVDAALAAGVRRFVHQSLGWIYAPGPGLADEDEPLDLDGDAARRSLVGSVLEAEQAAAEVPETVLLRYGLFYGPDTWYAPDGLKVDEARAGRLVANRDVTSFLHVDDAAAAAVQALDWPSGPVNVTDDEPAAGTDWMPVFCRAVGAADPAISTEERPVWVRGVANRKARGLGWAPVYRSWRDGFTAF
ncbi:NAD-dependent epimerase/dehydratase family protein [Microlunatus parietis]|uniref:Nucleoside-diphosphate-sugar epimerase n=1 Tax=Microlunatus parietis TaxID=682979 RepID=A0A7Y9LBT8_9ACTN|nr:NAD-dependent epimerase/dehydratase family protein [Microlunatus parietis]NYE70995.1 nucleoside-diphosphate-sugar epimerase [Microlunatus parietis]